MKLKLILVSIKEKNLKVISKTENFQLEIDEAVELKLAANRFKPMTFPRTKLKRILVLSATKFEEDPSATAFGEFKADMKTLHRKRACLHLARLVSLISMVFYSFFFFFFQDKK